MRFPVHASRSVSSTLGEIWTLLLSCFFLGLAVLDIKPCSDLKSVCLLGELCRALGMLISHYLFQKQISLRKGYTWDQKPL